MLAIRLLGAEEARDADGRVVEELLRQPKRFALLAYLAAAEPLGFHRRDVLVDLLWPDGDPAHARHSLNQALYFLRQALGNDVFVTRGAGDVALDTDGVSCDVWTFRQAIADGDFEAAVAAYGGPLLGGFAPGTSAAFEQWVDGERDRLSRSYATALEQLADACAARGALQVEIAWWRRLAEHDPYRTHVTLRLMAALEAVGDRAGALEQAARHAARLRDDLDAAPSPDVVTYAKRLRSHPLPHDEIAEDLLSRVTRAVGQRYTIEREIGSGGVATVYLAHDVRNRRQVALKVLHTTVADALAAELFLREMRIAATLHHPLILPLLDSGEADGVLYYAMPYVEGESLRARLEREGPLPIDESLAIAREVAEALGFAHDHDIVHRDVKPENILLDAGHAVIADFGVTGAVASAGDAACLDRLVDVGTAMYMSPEQAEGAADLDGRADLYSLGCVLYELLAGKPPFTGSTVEELVRQHRSAEPPPVTAMRRLVPAGVVEALDRSLAKAPADRFSSAAEFTEALEPSTAHTPPGFVRVDRRARRRRLMVGGAVGVAAVGMAVAVVGTQVFTSGPITVTTSSINRVTRDVGIELQPAISPDGEEVAYVGGNFPYSRLVVRSTIGIGSGGESRPAEEQGGRHRHPAWTPDGVSLRFFIWDDQSGGSWHEVGKLGGAVRTVSRPWPGGKDTWVGNNVLSPDGARVVASRGDSVFAYTADTGKPELLGVHPVESSDSPHSFAWSPDAQLIAYADGAIFWRDVLLVQGGSAIWIIEADGGEPVRVTGEGFVDISPAWLDDEHLLFVSDRDGPREVYVVEVGPRGPRGSPRKVAGATDAHTISYSILGRKLAFSKATRSQNIWSYPIDAGTVSIATGQPVTSENAVIQAHDVSPDGRWIVYSSDLRGDLDLYKRPAEGGNPRPIADSPNSEIGPRWSPDGTEIAFHRTVGDEMAVMVVSADGGTPVQVASAQWTWLPSWSPSGLELAFNSSETGRIEVWVVSREAIGGTWSEATQLTDFGCEPSDWAPDGSGVLCTVGPGGAGPVSAEADTSLVLVSREGEVLWRYDPSEAGLVVPSIYQKFSRDGSTIYAWARHEDGTEGIWAIPVHGGEPSLVVAYDRAHIAAAIWLAVGPDRLYLTVVQTEADIWVADVEVER